MAILLLNSGKTGETNRATLQRLANDRGDKIAFQQAPHFTHVMLNSKVVGKLFDSHEKAIAYLSSIKRTAPAEHADRASKSLKRLGAAKRNPGATYFVVEDDNFGDDWRVFYTLAEAQAFVTKAAGEIEYDGTPAQQAKTRAALIANANIVKRNPAGGTDKRNPGGGRAKRKARHLTVKNPRVGKYSYVVDSDERGQYRAHVDDPNDKTVWEASNEESEDGTFWPVEDGFMRNTRDMSGLLKYLQQMKVIPAGSTLVYSG